MSRIMRAGFWAGMASGLICAGACPSVPVQAAEKADKIVLVAGGGTEAPDAPAEKVRLVSPFGVDFDSTGRMVIVELEGQRAMRVDLAGHLTLLAGTGEKGPAGANGPALEAKFNGMHSVAIGPEDAIFVADTFNSQVRRIDPQTGEIAAFAGTGKKGDAGDGVPALTADIGNIYCIAFNRARTRLYLMDLDNRKVRKVDLATGLMTTMAGNGKKGVPEDNAVATDSPLVDPRAVAVGADETLYLLERSGHALRVITPDGKIRTVAGTGKPGFGGDDGPALEAMLRGPKHLCVDRDGTVLIADSDNHAVRRYDPKTAKITRVAGTGKQGAAGVGGDPLAVELHHPHGVWIGPEGFIYISDSGNQRVLKIVRETGVQPLGESSGVGVVPAVKVADRPLVQTAQFLPLKDGKIVAADAVGQWANLRAQIDEVARTWDAVPVRIHLYAATQEALDAVRTENAFGRAPVTITPVVGKLPHPDALIAADAVLVSARDIEKPLLEAPLADLRTARAAVMPAGARLYISGQAEKGDLPTATRLTLESLDRTLQAHGRSKADTIQIKAFVTPISEATVVREQIETFFGKDHTPPVTLVEWSSSLPIEIELVAWSGPAREGEPVEHLGAPGLNDSPVYCRVARINHGPTIFTGGLVGPAAGSGEVEVTGIFNTLKALLQAGGSDFRHLVKATYYVSKDEPGAKLNELRPKYYDPKRPPAASKAQVAGTGHAERGLILDMIAVPKP